MLTSYHHYAHLNKYNSQKLSGTMNVVAVLRKARQLYRDILSLAEVPCSLAPLIGRDRAWDALREPHFTCSTCKRDEHCGNKLDWLAGHS